MVLFWDSAAITWLSSDLSLSDSLVRSRFCSIVMIVMGEGEVDKSRCHGVGRFKIKGGDVGHKNDAQFSYR